MILKFKRLQIKIFVKILEKRVGLCSQKETREDKHILLWDFDNSKLVNIVKTLKRLQIKYKLPAIFLVKSSPFSYHAYSFTARPFREVIHILSDTPQVDMTYLRMGMVRGYYTLRITSRKNEGIFSLERLLPSIIKEEMDKSGMMINEYLTSNKGGHDAKG